jgi:hypothetical protein
MRTDVIVRRIAYVVVLLCAVGGMFVATRQDWPDAALIGLVGALALVTARKMAWRLRQDRGELSTPAHCRRLPVEI